MIVALSSVRPAKKSIETSAKIDTRRMRTLQSNIQPIIISAPHSQIENAMLPGSRNSNP